MNKQPWDVIIVGAGILGTFHAYFSGRKGLRTLLIEKNEFPSQASVRNFGMVIPSAMPNREWHRLALESVTIYSQLAEELNFPLQKTGTQYLATTPLEAQVLREFAHYGPDLEHQCQFLDAHQSREANPVVSPETCQASLLFPDDVRLDARFFLKTLLTWMIEKKLCHYQSSTVAVQVERDGTDCRVTTTDGAQWTAKHIVICNGSDFRLLFPQQFALSGLLRCKLQMMRTVPQEKVRLVSSLASGLSIRHYHSFRICPSWPQLKEEPINPELSKRGIHILMVQDSDGRIVVGDSHQYSSSDLDDNPDAYTEELILQEARRFIHLPSWKISERWPGIYCLHPQREIYWERIDERIHLITGIGGKGMTTSPALARESVGQIAKEF